MGKSNKKNKNDRINTIRKQYDAFLEEDKKRTERNEYILGKLDKMRSSTALVPISTKARYCTELSPFEIRPNNIRTKPEVRDSYLTNLGRQKISADILKKPMDELHILKEISKNYILIPKRRTPIENDYNGCVERDINDEDWKSKYNILDDLKKLEKEGQSDQILNHYNDNNMHNKTLDLSLDINIPNKQRPNLENELNSFNQPMPDKNTESTTINNLVNSSIEHDTAQQAIFTVPDINTQDSEKSNLPLQIVSVSINEEIKDDHTQPMRSVKQEFITSPQEETVTVNEKYNSEKNEKDLNLEPNVSPQIRESSSINHSAVYEDNINASDYTSTTATKKHVPSENINANISNIAVSDQTITESKPQKSCAEEFLPETIQLDRNIDNQRDSIEIQDLTSTERVELYDNTVINPESQIVLSETTTEEAHYYDPAQNTIPTDSENIGHPEHVEHESEINAFETEQKEMFYSEQSNADTYAYNQGEQNAGAYTDGYEQNDQYAYYEGVQEEQAYATNIDEHEETTERYDPHYNQQYQQSYESQQPDKTVAYDNGYDQQLMQNENLQLENTANYDNQQENAHLYQQENVVSENEVQENALPILDNEMYDQQLYADQPDIQEQIEQQLITEEGYVETSPVIGDELQTETEGKIEEVMDLTAPEGTIPDPKLS